MTKKLFLLFLLTLLTLTACGETTPAVSPYAEAIRQDTLPTGDVDRGAALFAGRVIGVQNAPGCISCHAPEDITLVGPSQVGMANRAADIITSADYTGEAQSASGYLWEAVAVPEAHLSSGFANVMYKAYGTKLTEQEIADLVAYMLTLE